MSVQLYPNQLDPKLKATIYTPLDDIHLQVALVFYCPFPGYVDYGRVLLVGNMGMYDYRAYVKKVRNNRQIRYACNKGFYLRDGPPGATCVAGRWSPAKLPRFSVESTLDKTFESSPLSGSSNWDALTKPLEVDPVLLKPNSAATINVIPSGDEYGKDFHRVKRQSERLSENDDRLQSSKHNDQNDPQQLELSSENGQYYDEENQHMRQLKLGVLKDDDNSRDRSGMQQFKRSFHHKFFDQERGLERIKRDGEFSSKREHRRNTKRKRSGRKKRKGVFERCEPLPTEPYLRAEVLKPGRDENYTYSTGARVKISCLHGHGLNINKTGIAKCRRGHWKPMKPVCEPLQCRVVEAPLSKFEYNGDVVEAATPISHGQVVRFKCVAGYSVLGSDNMRCWFGEWSVTGKNPECQPNPCQLPEIEHGSYKNGYKKGLMITHDSSVEYSCDPGYEKTDDVNEISCHLGEIEPSKPTCGPAPTTSTTSPIPGTSIVTASNTHSEGAKPGAMQPRPTGGKSMESKSLSSDDAKAQGLPDWSISTSSNTS
ncbi:Sushi/SCR/CCP domain [Trinorchestia longiramus]|nr:Sushi/SCR/CCP domain [Trinorchestia longiramus]